MIVKSITIHNFRSLKTVTVVCDVLTALVGPNGGGKSSVIRALELFYSPSPRTESEDWYDRNTDEDIEVELTFNQLGDHAKSKFAPYLQGDELTVARVLSLREGRILSRYHGSRLQNPSFAQIRSAANARDARAAYDTLRADPQYGALPGWTSQAAAEVALKEWEEGHPEQCLRLRDDGQFFGFSEAAHGYLGRFTRLISIPAVRDAVEEAGEGRGRALTDLMDLVVRNRLASHESIARLRTETHGKYNEILNEAQKETDELATHISSRLANYVPGATVRLSLDSSGAVAIELPKAQVRLVEDGYETDVGRTGHGLQRAFIMAMLQELAAAQVSAPSTDQGAEAGDQPGPNILLAIEEPELYQHQSRQRRLASILAQLSRGILPGLAERIQVMYVTHSPLFAGLDRFEQLRMLRKTQGDAGKPKVTRVTAVSGDDVAEAVWKAADCKDRHGDPVVKFTWASLRPRLLSLITPALAEGFFADVAVLVEGPDDRAALLGVGLARTVDLESEGYAVLQCGGKTSIDRPAVIFRAFGVPTYLIWDSDKSKGANPEENRRLLRIVGAEIEDYPAAVMSSYSCFEDNLEATIKHEIGGADFDLILQECMDEFEFSQREDAMKNPLIISEVIRRAAVKGHKSATLEAIVDALLATKKPEDA